jgi:hypothetical protein
MPDDYPVASAIRQIPTAALALLKRVGYLGQPATPAAADAAGAARLAETPHATSLPGRMIERVASAMGAYPLPNETTGQYQDAVFGPPEQWFPTPFLANRARGGPAPHDINLPAGTVAPNDPRWRTFAMDATGPKGGIE